MKLRTISLFLIAFIISSCTKLPVYESTKVTEAPQDPSLNYGSDGALYGVFSDEQNVYLHISTNDMATKLKMLQLGFTVWLDEKGKKNTIKGIVLPQTARTEKNTGAQSNAGGERSAQSRSQSAELQKGYERSLKMITLIGMNGATSKEVVDMQANSAGVVAEISFDKSDELNYVLTIPREKIFTTEKYSDGIFSIGLDSGAMVPRAPAQASSGGRGGGGGQRGGGGGGGGGSRGGGGGRAGGTAPSPSAERQGPDLSDPIDVWFKVNLDHTEAL